MFSDHDETSPSIATVLAPSAACSMLAVQQQKADFLQAKCDFMHFMQRGKTRERMCTYNGSKHVKSAKDVPLGGFVKNWSPHPHYPPKSENFVLQKPSWAPRAHALKQNSKLINSLQQ